VHSAIQPATIKSLSGVEVPVVRGQALSIGEVITTGAKGRVRIDMSGNDEWISRTVYVAPNSSLRIESLEDQLALDIRRRQKRYNPGGVFGLLRGAIRYWNDKRMYGGPPGHPDYDPNSYFGFSIRAGVAVCGGRGTDVVVTYEPGRKVAGFYLREGAIQLETAQGTRGVKGSGQVTVTGGRAGPTQPLNAQQWARLERATHIAQPAAHAATPAPVPQPAVPAPAPPVVAPTPPVAPHTPTPTVDPRVLELLRRLTPGWGTARPSLRGLAIGRSTPAEVQAALGPPRFVSRTAQGSFVCEHDGRALGLHTVVVHYGQRGRVAQLELRFASALPRDEVARKFGLGPPAATVPFAGCVVELHPANRVELTVQGGAVTSLRTTGAPPARVTTMPQPTPPPTLPPTPAIPPPTAPPPVPPAPEPAPPTLRQVQTVPAQAVGTRGATTPRVTVRRVWYQANMQVAGDPGLVIYADLLASGCKGQQMTATVRLRQHTGQAVMAARGAPAQCVDQRGRFVAQATDQVLHDTAQWQAYQVFVPYRFLGLTSGQVHNLAISFTATCKGHRTGMEALCTFRTR